MTFLVVPVLVVEDIGPVEAIKRSAHLLKKTWGEQLIGEIGISLFFGIIALALTIIFVPVAIYSSLHHMMDTTIFLGAVYLLTILSIVVISSTLHSIYVAAVYKYAAEGEVAGYFSEDVLRNSFRRK
jgi:uncharacterized membrane protein